MTTVNQGMSVEEIERVVAQRVANAIEAIAIYKTKTNMARKPIGQTEQQESQYGLFSMRMLQEEKNQQTHTCYEYGNLGHFKSKCPIVKFQKRVNKKISTLSERQAENKRKLNNTSKDNQNQQQPNKRKNTGKAYATGHREKKYYGGSKPLCPKCNYHHDGPCPPKCHRCNIVGHLVRNCRRPTNDNTINHQRGTGTSQKANCYECGNQGHYKRDCPERKNQSHKNQIGGTGAHGVVHTLRGEETDQDPNNIKDEIKAYKFLRVVKFSWIQVMEGRKSDEKKLEGTFPVTLKKFPDVFFPGSEWIFSCFSLPFGPSVYDFDYGDGTYVGGTWLGAVVFLLREIGTEEVPPWGRSGGECDGGDWKNTCIVFLRGRCGVGWCLGGRVFCGGVRGSYGEAGDPGYFRGSSVE
ncbi:uncharacterized mitochondrial protein-like protein [Tanacetum coccineum]